jgi:hypothetical protein
MRICVKAAGNIPIPLLWGGQADKTSESMRWWQRPAPLPRMSPARGSALPGRALRADLHIN